MWKRRKTHEKFRVTSREKILLIMPCRVWNIKDDNSLWQLNKIKSYATITADSKNEKRCDFERRGGRGEVQKEIKATYILGIFHKFSSPPLPWNLRGICNINSFLPEPKLSVGEKTTVKIKILWATQMLRPFCAPFFCVIAQLGTKINLLTHTHGWYSLHLWEFYVTIALRHWKQ